MYIQDIYIGTIAVNPIVVGIIQLLKKLGMPKTWAPWANAVLTIIGYAVSLLLLQYPHWEPTLVKVLTVVIMFLSAGGFYEVGDRTISLVKKKLTALADRGSG